MVVRLGDVADVVLGAENYEEDVQFNGQKAVFMGIWVLNANSLDVIHRVRAEIPGIQAETPAGMHRRSLRCDRVYRGCHRRGPDNAQRDAAHRDRSDLPVPRIAALRAHSVVAIPVSLVGAVFLMLVAGFTINLLTLLAIVLSVGLVVDDAIVMVENVERTFMVENLRSGPPSTPPVSWWVRSSR